MAFVWGFLWRGKFQRPVVSFTSQQRNKSVALDNKIDNKLCGIHGTWVNKVLYKKNTCGNFDFFFLNKEFLILACTISNSICKMFWLSAIREQLKKSKMMARVCYLHLVNFNQVRIYVSALDLCGFAAQKLGHKSLIQILLKPYILFKHWNRLWKLKI